MIVFRYHEDDSVAPLDRGRERCGTTRMIPSHRSIVAENAASFICSPASSSRIGSSRTSISSVSTFTRFFVCAKTKRATFSLCLPCRAVPRITGITSGRSILADISILSDIEPSPCCNPQPVRHSLGEGGSAFRTKTCRWPDSNRHGPFTAQRILSPLRLPFRHIGAVFAGV